MSSASTVAVRQLGAELLRTVRKDSVNRLPATLGGVASKGAEVLADTAQAAGKVVNAAGKGLFSGIGTPVVIGAGLLGAYLLFRRRNEREA